MEQCWTLAGLATTAVLLNWITTGDHLLRSLSLRHLWPVAGMDILLMASAVVATAIALRVSRLAQAVEVRHA
jgi:hypothetical protein